ncbi:3-ketoacyl-CoA thiolase, mitochondrial-like [Anticarsia gemmatalis]|uniref:3-ketoacyl-CoA thiolase, mitochondrial-like n=1 Tax=Anticarsia gemmatalis TaxID=129554 RepID=UPI003F763C76
MAAAIKKGVFIVAGKRTPFGKFGGSLRDVLAEDLFATAAAAALKAAGVAPHDVDTVNIGQISPLSVTGMSPRHAALKAGIPHDKPVLGMNLMSGSALSALIVSTEEILLGSAQISLAGGMETLSSVPHLVYGLRFGTPLGKQLELVDFLSTSNYDSYCGMWLLQTSDAVAVKYGVTRSEADEFTVRSQRRWKDANDNGRFDSELVPVTLTRKGKEVLMERDEQPRPDITLEQLSQLPALFNGGVTTSGNVCGINDGAAAIVLASEEALKQHNLKPLSRIVGWSRVGVEPKLAGEAAIPAVQSLLRTTGYTIDDMDLIEIHETYATVIVSAAKQLKVDTDKLNVDGGSLAIGHPSGASGARIISHLTYELRRRGLKRGLCAVIIGGGQGLAVMIETV